jgi:hypothetical protein
MSELSPKFKASFKLSSDNASQDPAVVKEFTDWLIDDTIRQLDSDILARWQMCADVAGITLAEFFGKLEAHQKAIHEREALQIPRDLRDTPNTSGENG